MDHTARQASHGRGRRQDLGYRLHMLYEGARDGSTAAERRGGGEDAESTLGEGDGGCESLRGAY